MDVSAHLAHLTGVPTARLRHFGHRHAWNLYQAELSDGRDVFVKVADTNPDSVTGTRAGSDVETSLDSVSAATDGSESEGIASGDAASDAMSGGSKPGAITTGVLEAEAAGLHWLADSGIDIVPPVLAADSTMLVLPWLSTESATADAAEKLGRDLAALHATGVSSYGASWPGFIATLPLDNTITTGEWGSWYADYRLAPYLRTAAPILGRDGTRLIERVMDRIDHLAGPPEPPSRIHGDLWSGNILWSADRAMLIDPAAHGGHRETDLAMLALFGAPHLDRIRAAYDEATPLGSGWRQRIPLHQLHPLLVHVVLFGDSYRGMALSAAAAALSG
ncbi:fructosamine kinase family protein [Nocardia sp. NBC_00511]|uniref:fructosamine kinase family protein n=1 Tax=Nocardia sp. NBC_00511 TaxID=2903591 RepID=UPI0030DE2689